MKIALDLHDFSVVENRLDLLLKLKELYPDFKVSLFTVPIDKKKDWGSYLVRRENLAKIKANLDWMQIIPHGLYHDSNQEMMVGYEVFKHDILPKIEEAFQTDGLPYEKGFCAPHWRWTEEVVKVLDEFGWWGAIDPRQNKPCPKRFYAYSHKLDEPLEGELLKIHGHIYGTKNDIGLNFNKLTNLKDVEWHYITDFIENK